MSSQDNEDKSSVGSRAVNRRNILLASTAVAAASALGAAASVEMAQAQQQQAKAANKPFFIWHNTTRMHVFDLPAAEVSGQDEL